MIETQEDILAGLKQKIKALIVKYEEACAKNTSLQKQLEEENKNSKDKDKLISELSTRYNALKIAKSLELSDEESDKAKEKINRIVREIDKCLALLNE